MTSPVVYELSVSVKLPELATEGEPFNINYVFENTGTNNFPGGTIPIIMWWPNIGNTIYVNHPVDVPALAPGQIHISATLTERPLRARDKWFHLQCIKEESTLRVSPKGAKPPPRIVFRYGEQEKEIKTFLSYRKVIKNIIRKMETKRELSD